MNAPAKEPSLLRDLALIYLTLAHGTDQVLSRVEIEEISRRLSAWQTHATEETVLSAVKDALEVYTETSARGEVQEAVRRVPETVDREQLSIIVDDLTEIAMSDDKFLHEEGTFIGDLTRSWNLHTEEGRTGDNPPWSILTGHRKNGWSALHDLALIYLHLAHRTDGELDTREIETISETLNEWIPDVGEDEVLNVVQDAMHAHVQGPDRRLFEDSVQMLKEHVPGHQLESIMADLQQIAKSDGTVLPEERDVIRSIARAWDITLP